MKIGLFVICIVCGCMALETIQEARETCKELMPKCVDQAEQDSTLEKCITPNCVEKDGEGLCDYSTVNNCLKSDVAEQVRQLNQADPNVCYTVECKAGECVSVKVPKEMEDNACWIAVCVEYVDGWKWDLKPSKESLSCVSDDCVYRECVNKSGCEQIDICSNRTTECVTYSCNKNNQCVGFNTTLEDYECMHQICEDGKIKMVLKNLTEACPNEDLCLEASCSRSGTCMFTKSLPPGNDTCTNYTCDPKTGWSEEPLCDDGLFCTIDHCNNGICRFTKRVCSDEVNLTACYPTADCNERQKKCTRTLLKCQSEDATMMCLNGKCVTEEGATEDRWAVALDFSKTFNPNSVDPIEFAAMISRLTNFKIVEQNVAIEVNPDGDCPSILLLVEKRVAYAIKDAVDQLDKGKDCQMGILCFCNNTRVIGNGDVSSISDLPSQSTSSSSVKPHSTSSVASQSTSSVKSHSTSSVASQSTSSVKPHTSSTTSEKSDQSKDISVEVGERDAKTCVFVSFVALFIALMNLF